MNILLYILSYLVGAIPTGYLFCKYLFNLDITQHGSGNIGATNVSRVLGSKKYFFLIFFLDALKAAAVLNFAQSYVSSDELLLLAGLVLIGNGNSIFLNFRGGKGVSTTLGVLFVVAPTIVTVFFVMSWLSILLITKRSDISSLSGSGLMILFYAHNYSVSGNLFVFLSAVCGWLLVRHTDNIYRIYQG